MKSILIAATSTLALIAMSAPAAAQMSMPGMTMPMPAGKHAPKKAQPPKRANARKSFHSKAGAMKAPVTHVQGAAKTMTMPRQQGGGMSVPVSTQQQGQGSSKTMPMDQSQTQHGTMPRPPQGQTSGAMSMPMSQTQTGQPVMGQTAMGHGGDGMSTTGAYGSYPVQRESSGTAWQPDASTAMSGPMLMSDDWMLMAHGTLNLVYDHQAGPRGDDKTFASGMLMGMARHPLGNGTVQFRAMVSPDPIMGPAGYPLLLATGETANGQTPLVDRQHPHDFFMELSASVSQEIGSKSSLFLYAGLPGEPAFGPPAFMHRESILDSPEAPITHHWLDSTHITFGVVTAGLVLDRVKIEASRFNGREPDQHRWNIETGPLDSTSVRASWNPTRTLALQGSWAHLQAPEQPEPGVNQTRWSASALWANDVAPGWHVAATLAWGRKSSLGHNDDGFAAEASVRHSGWTVFGRGELAENRELAQRPDERAFRVGKVSLGAVRDFKVADHFSFGVGGLLSVNIVPDGLAPLYGGHNPNGAMGFVRLKLD